MRLTAHPGSRGQEPGCCRAVDHGFDVRLTAGKESPDTV